VCERNAKEGCRIAGTIMHRGTSRRWFILATVASIVASGLGLWGWSRWYSPAEKNRQVALRWLERPLDMPYEKGGSLYDIISDVYKRTGGRTETGMVLYIDPDGLNEAKASYKTPVRYSSRGTPLGQSLSELLAPLGLGYFAEYNPFQPCLTITSLQDVARREVKSHQ
jgi:hypothetical protein